MRLAIQASSVAVGMAVPGVIGGYLDHRLGTNFCVLIGLGLGVIVGTIQLLALARSRSKPRQPKGKADEDRDRDAGA
jgi:hypothetical protein